MTSAINHDTRSTSTALYRRHSTTSESTPSDIDPANSSSGNRQPASSIVDAQGLLTLVTGSRFHVFKILLQFLVLHKILIFFFPMFQFHHLQLPPPLNSTLCPLSPFSSRYVLLRIWVSGFLIISIACLSILANCNCLVLKFYPLSYLWPWFCGSQCVTIKIWDFVKVNVSNLRCVICGKTENNGVKLCLCYCEIVLWLWTYGDWNMRRHYALLQFIGYRNLSELHCGFVIV